MLLLRSLPDDSTHDPALADLLRAKWGRENTVIWGRSRRADFGPHAHTLSIRAAWGGTQVFEVEGRCIAVDDDNFLVLNQGRICATNSRQRVDSFGSSPRRRLAIPS